MADEFFGFGGRLHRHGHRDAGSLEGPGGQRPYRCRQRDALAGARVDKLSGLTFVRFAREGEAAKVHLLVLAHADAPAVGIARRVERQHHAAATHDECPMDAPAVLEHVRDAIDSETTDDGPEVDGGAGLHAGELGARELELSGLKRVEDSRPFSVVWVERRRAAGLPITEQRAGGDVEGARGLLLQGLGEIPERLKMVARSDEGTVGHAVDPGERAAVVAGVDLEVQFVDGVEDRFCGALGVGAILVRDADPKARAHGLMGEIVDDVAFTHGERG